MRLLDIFCGAGGASMGYHRAGFDVMGIDIAPQKHYPFAFVQADALKYIAAYGCEYDVIHASPPCQAYSISRNLKTARHDYPDLVAVTRAALVATGRPYVIENVVGAPLINAVMLCGSMFGLGVLRHRLFETDPVIWFPPTQCQHEGMALPMWWRRRREVLAQGKIFRYITVAGRSFLVPEAQKAMGIDWMTRREISQAIPPAYTEWIGRQIIARDCNRD